MISLLHPELVGYLQNAGPGLWPFHVREAEDSEPQLKVVVKASADFALAAKQKKHIKFHFYNLDVDETFAPGIITAVYDRANAPIVIQTVCIDENMRRIAVELSQIKEVGIYFFDFHNSELFGGRWALNTEPGVSKLLSQPFSNVELKKSLEYYTELIRRFGNPADDGVVIEANLLEAETRDDVVIIHLTEEAVQSKTAAGMGVYQSSITVTEKPGEPHEAEIARLLARIFPREGIFVNPDIEKGKEFCDVLAIGKHEVIAVQAKTTLRTEASLEEDDDRRASRLNKHFKKALKQARGAERAFYLLRKTINLQGRAIEIKPTEKLIFHLIVIAEKHPALLSQWSEALASFASETTPVVVLDSAEFRNLISRSPDRERFTAALMTISENFVKRKKIGEYSFGIDRLASFEN